MLEWFPGSKYFLDFHFNRQLGNIQSYTQWSFGIGYRFDSYRKHRTEALR